MLEAGYTVEKDLPTLQDSTQLLPWLRQYIFVAATLPSEGGKSVAADIKKLFPRAVWLTSENLHRSVDLVRHKWVKVSYEDWGVVLQSVIKDDTNYQNRSGRTLVFAKDGSAVENVADVLKSAGITAMVYHSKIPTFERERMLESFSNSAGGVMVCTDAASRGLDIPQVMHVVQADFAASAVDFLHRVGRTGRAGSPGTSTSLYRKESEPLVKAIQTAVANGQPVEGAFSRKRSFRKKFKRYGKYVPRGKVVEEDCVGQSDGS